MGSKKILEQSFWTHVYLNHSVLTKLVLILTAERGLHPLFSHFSVTVTYEIHKKKSICLTN